MVYYGVSLAEWDVVRPFLPPRSRVGRPRADDRMVLNGILYVLTTGSRWSRVKELVDGLSGRPRELYADAAYDTENIRRCLESMGVEPNIPVNPRNGRRPRPYNVGLYRRMRSAVERFFGWIKSFRRIVVRYERLESTYKALTTIASIIIHLRYGI
jgi:transposase